MAGKETERIILIVALAVIVVVALGAFSSMGGRSGWGGMMCPGMMGPGMMGGSWTGFGWFPMLIGPIIAILFIGLIVLGIYYVFSGQVRISKPERRPLDIIKERYANGEIDEEQYEKMKEQLRG